MAERTGLEPATSGVTGQHSNQTELPFLKTIIINVVVPQMPTQLQIILLNSIFCKYVLKIWQIINKQFQYLIVGQYDSNAQCSKLKVSFKWVILIYFYKCLCFRKCPKLPITISHINPGEASEAPRFVKILKCILNITIKVI